MATFRAMTPRPWAAEDLHAGVAALIDAQRALGDALEALYASLVRGTPPEIEAATQQTTRLLERSSAAAGRFSAALVAAHGGGAQPASFAAVVDALPLAQRARLIDIGERLAEEIYRVGTLRLSIASLVTELSEHSGRVLSTLRMLASCGPLYDRRSTVLPVPTGRRLIEATA